MLVWLGPDFESLAKTWVFEWIVRDRYANGIWFIRSSNNAHTYFEAQGLIEWCFMSIQTENASQVIWVDEHGCMRFNTRCIDQLAENDCKKFKNSRIELAEHGCMKFNTSCIELAEYSCMKFKASCIELAEHGSKKLKSSCIDQLSQHGCKKFKTSCIADQLAADGCMKLKTSCIDQLAEDGCKFNTSCRDLARRHIKKSCWSMQLEHPHERCKMDEP